MDYCNCLYPCKEECFSVVQVFTKIMTIDSAGNASTCILYRFMPDSDIQNTIWMLCVYFEWPATVLLLFIIIIIKIACNLICEINKYINI